MKEEIYKLTGRNIRRARLALDWTQQELADKIGKSLNFTGKIEIGFSKPSLDTLIDIAVALNVPLKNLFDFKQKN
ncbi:MAG: helix-turn-helix transcriptional regulator [Heliobacteriaceae bacterium]|jgi:transcriptional regulator with XRE-family HTH domain|nr:helix-turn-helix transcriptional regulator [Heliobacteriaceae bacterium]